jgi:glyoxylase-like metal-dependent hydrolase (beta-lactamase superfamily II)
VSNSIRSTDGLREEHLHTDHTGLGFVRDRDQALHKAFPRADYLVAGAEWDPFWRGEIKVGAPSWEGFMVPMSGVLRRFDDGAEVWPGVTALITPGHSPGHTTYVVSAGGGRRILVFGDAFHTPAQLTHPEWASGPDVDVDGVRRARATLLARLGAPRTYGFAFHFGGPGLRPRRAGPGRRRPVATCARPEAAARAVPPLLTVLS